MLLSQEQRIKGSLLGLAWGDILGCPVEGWRDWEIETVYGQYQELPQEYPLEQINKLNSNKLKRLRPLGLHSDDTQQALALINLCLEEGKWSKAAWADILVKGMARGTWRGYGRNFSGAVNRLKKGNLPEHSGSASAGMGAAMRVAPLGGIFWHHPQVLAQATMEASLTTHADIRAGALSYAVTYTVAALIAYLRWYFRRSFWY
ncbi:MAG: ADP-ribosylglycohydrolase family protein [Spirulinaceae cyanobacterium]